MHPIFDTLMGFYYSDNVLVKYIFYAEIYPRSCCLIARSSDNDKKSFSFQPLIISISIQIITIDNETKVRLTIRQGCSDYNKYKTDFSHNSYKLYPNGEGEKRSGWPKSKKIRYKSP